jgi:Leucine-rich repeat (LRR) protein
MDNQSFVEDREQETVSAPNDSPPNPETMLKTVVQKATKDFTPKPMEPKSYEKIPSSTLKSRLRTKKNHSNTLKIRKKIYRLNNRKNNGVRETSNLPEFGIDDGEQSTGVRSLESRSSHHNSRSKKYFGVPTPTMTNDEKFKGSHSIQSSHCTIEQGTLVALLHSDMQTGVSLLLNPSGVNSSRPLYNEKTSKNRDRSNKDLDAYISKVTELEPIRFEGDHQNPHGSALFRDPLSYEWKGWSTDFRPKRPRIGKWKLVAAASVVITVVIFAATVATIGSSGRSDNEFFSHTEAIGLTFTREIPERPHVPIPNEFSRPTGAAPDGSWSSDKIMQLLELLTAADTLANPSSPQGQAVEWLITDVINSHLESSTRIVQRYILASLAFSCTSETWKSVDGWLTSDHECTWYGVRCGKDGSNSFNDEDLSIYSAVTFINLQDNNLRGSLPSELAKLRDLASLQLQANFLVGSIPGSLSQLERLHTLFLDRNLLTGGLPTNIGQLKHIRSIDVSNNSLRGTFPESFGEATTLQDLRFTNNKLTGNFPADMSGLRQLSTLLIANNEIVGTIPAHIASLPTLIYFHVYENKLVGVIPEFKSTVLQQVHLDSNGLTGHIPAFTATGSLFQLRLERNRLSGTIPVTVGDNIGLEVLWLFNNKLSGPIPHEVGRLENLVSFRVHGNSLTGTVPDTVCNLKQYKLKAFHATCDESNTALQCSCCDEGCTE